ncbi:hypothetical protein FZC74_14070 [Sutcliffiella horikoshii]|uniref:Uncharacterized protein n=1 Tax=Sutcliffiella horikoshii TaxID=79883 RepID=A0AA94WR38_9BACI|nr:hypothetical protein [Sutcliffiella horikoshii]TYS58114.1 hypothetical protein FZC74_14070 [Sutcliffiella horikoshii]
MGLKAKLLVGVLTVAFAIIFFYIQQIVLRLLPTNTYVGIFMTILLFFGLMFCYIVAKQLVDFFRLKRIFISKK